MNQKTVLVIPVYNEEDNIFAGVTALRAAGFESIIAGIDPHTTDQSETCAENAGAIIAKAERPGYDSAVAAAVSSIPTCFPQCAYVVFFDSGGKFPIEKIAELIAAADAGADLVLASRTQARHLLYPHQRFGTYIVLQCILVAFNKTITDISPFRLVRLSVLHRLHMQPKKYRWPSEMLVKCLALNVHICEIETPVLPRSGTSKISSSLVQSIRAGIEMFSSLQFIRYTNN